MNTFTCLALALCVGLVFSRLARLVHLPNVTAYLVGGLLMGPFALRLLSPEMVQSFGVITEAALGFIAYSIGTEFRGENLRKIGVRPVIITVFQGMMAVLLVDVGLIALGFDVPMALMLGAIATATAPAATLMVVRQYKAHGPVTDILLPVVAMDDALGLMIFSISTAVARGWAGSDAMSVRSMLLVPLVEIFGSLGLGLALGLVLTCASRFFHSRGNKLALSIMAVFAGVGLCGMWGLSSLLVCMMIGAVMVNLCGDRAVLMEQCDRFTPPLFLLFFVISGAELDLAVLPTVGLLGVAYLVLRSVGKWSGALLGATVVHAQENVRKYLGLTLLPQAGVAIGMAQMAMQQLPGYGAQIRAVVLAATLVYELVGPLATKIALTRAGEITGKA
ncbi:MAG: cation:proton antiporter [Clostridia bacterium]